MERFLRRNISPLLSKGRRKLAAWGFIWNQVLDQAEDVGALAIQPETGGKHLNEYVRGTIGTVFCSLLIILIAHLHNHL